MAQEQSKNGPIERALRNGKTPQHELIGVFYREHNEAIFRFCLVLLGNPHDAEDAMSATFEGLLRHCPVTQESSEGNLRALVFAAARHRCIDSARRRNRWRSLLLRISTTRTESTGVEELAEARSLLAAIAALPKETQALLPLRMAGLKWREIAAIENANESTVRMTVSRTVQRLAEQFRGGSDD